MIEYLRIMVADCSTKLNNWKVTSKWSAWLYGQHGYNQVYGTNLQLAQRCGGDAAWRDDGDIEIKNK
jgi:hypothetical protein